MSLPKLARLVAEAMPDVRVEALALGARADLVAMNAIVEATGGDVVQIDARDNLGELVRELRLRAEVPLARNVRIETPDGLVDVRHNELAGLRPGDELIVTGKLAHPVRGEVRLLADGPTGPIEARFPIDLAASRTATAEEHRNLPRTWAQMEIATEIVNASPYDAGTGENAALRDASLDLALPPISSASDLPIATQAILQAAADGSLTPSEAQTLAGVLETHRKSLELADLEQRLAAVEY